MKFYRKIEDKEIAFDKTTYQAQVKKWLRNRFDIFTAAANYLLLQHSLKHHWDETLPLASVADVHLVAEARLDQILKQKQ